MLQALRSVAAYALPPRCQSCGVPVGADGQFCAECWSSLHFIGPPWCARCNLPFDYQADAEACCDSCAVRPPRHAGVRAAVAYGPVARRLALKLKYGGRMGAADTMAALMLRHLPAGTDLLVPVPLHRWRLWQRGYNQAALIAAGLTRASGTERASDLLVRTRRTPVLRSMSGRERARAVAGAFALARGAEVRLAGRTVVLVDDVHTSGATVTACADVLLGAGAARVTILCWARVLGAGD